jgi:hypothetical protein
MLRYFLRSEQRNQQHELKKVNRETTLPLRLQAYERFILLLERISLESLLMRIAKQNMTARQLQQEILKNIRTEFDHNLSQQLYISNDAWQKILSAKSTITKFVNLQTQKVGEKESAMKLSQQIFNEIMENKKDPARDAIEYLKREIRKEM